VDLIDTRDNNENEAKEDAVVFHPPTEGNNGRNDDTQQEDDAEQGQNESRRGRGRLRIVHTGDRGRPKKEYQIQGTVNVAEEELFLAEISLNKAMHGPNSDEWFRTIVTEMKSILKNNT